MNPVKLDEHLQPTVLIQNYDSCIWAERYNTVGDFQIVAPDVSSFMNLLPVGTRISLLDTDVVMEVETHQIDRKKNSPEKLTIKGRAAESFLDRRVSVKSLTDRSDWKINVYQPADVAYAIIHSICVLGIVDTNDIFDNFTIIPSPDYLVSTGPVKDFVVPRGNLLSTVLSLLQADIPIDFTTTPDTPKVVPHGIRSRRPPRDETDLRLQLYLGEDKSDVVYFDASRDLLDDGTYLFSSVGFASDAYIVGNRNAAKMAKYSTPTSSYDRRVILVDGTTSGINEIEILQQQGSLSLTEARHTSMFDGTINQDNTQYKYGTDYFLGDTVKLVGDYGLIERARVTEFIRSQDATGLKEYPTLETIDN